MSSLAVMGYQWEVTAGVGRKYSKHLSEELSRSSDLKLWWDQFKTMATGYFPELAAIFLTMASTSLRSLSFRLTE